MGDGGDDSAGVVDDGFVGEGGEMEEFKDGRALSLDCFKESEGDEKGFSKTDGAE